MQHSQQEQTGRATARTGTGGGQEQEQELRKEQGTEARRSYAEVAARAVTRSRAKKLELQ